MGKRQWREFVGARPATTRLDVVRWLVILILFVYLNIRIEVITVNCNIVLNNVLNNVFKFVKQYIDNVLHMSNM